MRMPNLTLADFRSDIKTRLDEVGGDALWSTSELRTKINRAYLRVAMDTEQFTKTLDFTLRANCGWYGLPVDTMVPKYIYGPQAWGHERIFPSDWQTLDRAQRRLGDWEKEISGTSVLFVPFSYNKFLIWPSPKISTTASLFYVATPPQLLNDVDSTQLNFQAQKLIPIYATYLCLRKDNFPAAMVYLQEYRYRMPLVRSELANHGSFRPMVMRPASAFDQAQRGHPNMVMRP